MSKKLFQIPGRGSIQQEEPFSGDFISPLCESSESMSHLPLELVIQNQWKAVKTYPKAIKNFCEKSQKYVVDKPAVEKISTSESKKR